VSQRWSDRVQVIHEMDENRTGFGVWTCYNAYILVRRISQRGFTISNIVLRDRAIHRLELDEDETDDYDGSSVLKFLLSLCALASNVGKDHPDLGYWVREASSATLGAGKGKGKQRSTKKRKTEKDGGEETESAGGAGRMDEAGPSCSKVPRLSMPDEDGDVADQDTSNELIVTPNALQFPSVSLLSSGAALDRSPM